LAQFPFPWDSSISIVPRCHEKRESLLILFLRRLFGFAFVNAPEFCGI
jgi:hypothetical protein